MAYAAPGPDYPGAGERAAECQLSVIDLRNRQREMVRQRPIAIGIERDDLSAGQPPFEFTGNLSALQLIATSGTYTLRG
jgi:hypothetical protein